MAGLFDAWRVAEASRRGPFARENERLRASLASVEAELATEKEISEAFEDERDAARTKRDYAIKLLNDERSKVAGWQARAEAAEAEREADRARAVERAEADLTRADEAEARAEALQARLDKVEEWIKVHPDRATPELRALLDLSAEGGE